jgi:hypothetical protein
MFSHAGLRRRAANRPDTQPMVARADYGMIRPGRSSRRGPHT